MNMNEKAYCKHDLNVIYGESVEDLESHYPKTQVSSCFGVLLEDFSHNYVLKNLRVSNIVDFMKKKGILFNKNAKFVVYDINGLHYGFCDYMSDYEDSDLEHNIDNYTLELFMKYNNYWVIYEG